MIQFLLNYISWSKFNLANIFHSPDLITVPLFIIPQLVFIDGNKHILIFFIWLPVFILLIFWKFCSLILVPQVVTFITVTFWHNFSSYIVSNDLLMIHWWMMIQLALFDTPIPLFPPLIFVFVLPDFIILIWFLFVFNLYNFEHISVTWLISFKLFFFLVSRYKKMKPAAYSSFFMCNMYFAILTFISYSSISTVPRFMSLKSSSVTVTPLII